MSITLRETKGAPLTHVEMDTNIKYLSYKFDLVFILQAQHLTILEIIEKFFSESLPFITSETSPVTFDEIDHFICKIQSNNDGNGASIVYDIESLEYHAFREDSNCSLVELPLTYSVVGSQNYLNLDVPNGEIFYLVGLYGNESTVTITVPALN